MSDSASDAPPFGACSINSKVAERIAGCAPEVEQRLIDSLAEKEVSRRVELIGQGLSKLDQMTRERYKLAKPTNVTYNLDNTIASESYSKEALEALKKHDEKFDKLQRAVEKALKGDLKDLPGLVNSKD
jgi:hypothetical protein